MHKQKTIPAKKPVIQNKTLPVFKTSLDSFSYAIGVEAASYYKSQGARGINYNLVQKAFQDVFGDKPLLLTSQICNMTVQKQMQEFTSNKSQTQKEESKKFYPKIKNDPE